MPSTKSPTLGANPTKQFIIETLSDEWPLSARTIYNKLTKKYQFSVTYQAVHKALKEMSEQHVISKNDNAYSLSMEWIKQVNAFGEKIKKDYENPIKQKLAFENSFTSLFDAYMFFLSELEKNLIESGNAITVFHGIHMWNCMLVRSEEEARLKAVTDKSKLYVLAKSSYKFDEIMKKYWKSFGIKVKIGFACTSNFDVIVIGDKVYYMHYPEDLLESMNKIYSKISDISDFDIAKLNKNIIYKKCKIYVIINKNKTIADLIRQWTVAQF